MAGLPGAPAADGFQIAELLVISFFAMHFDVGKFIKFGICFFTELLNVFFGDGIARSSEQVHTGHAVIAHGGVEGMVQSLHIHSNALYLVLYKPSAGFDAGTAGIMIILLGV